AADFQAKYPYVQPDLFRGDEPTLITRATQEAQAGQQGFDLIESPISAIRVLYAAEMLTPYYSPPVAAYPDTYKTPAADGLVESATDRIDFASFGYNGDAIADSAVPKTLE